jgi:hypothetical protein
LSVSRCEVEHLSVALGEAFGEMAVTCREGAPEPVEERGSLEMHVTLDDLERRDPHAKRTDVR